MNSILFLCALSVAGSSELVYPEYVSVVADCEETVDFTQHEDFLNDAILARLDFNPRWRLPMFEEFDNDKQKRRILPLKDSRPTPPVKPVRGRQRAVPPKAKLPQRRHPALDNDFPRRELPTIPDLSKGAEEE